VAGFIDVLLRGLILCGMAVTLGGVAFALVVVRPVARLRLELAGVLARTFTLVGVGAAAVGLAQLAALLLQLTTLAGGGAWPLAAASETLFFQVSTGRMALALALVAVVAGRRRAADSAGWAALLALLAAALGLLAAGTSHAAARVEGRLPLLLLDAVHQVAAFVWVGGLLHLVVTALSPRVTAWPALLLPRFSALAQSAVAALVLSGLGLSLTYIDALSALTGTAYGLMVATKVVLFGGLLALGAMNFLEVRGLEGSASIPSARLRRYVEVEFGLGVTVLLAAASLTSLPPAVDVVADRATVSEVARVFTPKMPRFSSPPHESLPVDDRLAPRTDADRGWSEYNHHTAGLFVLSMGLLAIASRARWGGWARHWPLIFLGLAAFLLVRNDPGAWPLGPLGFWESMTYPEVLQHRLAVVLVVIFAVFEWGVRTGHVGSPRAALVFPLLCVAGGALLLTHSHASFNLKSEFLVEITHAPLGVLALFVGWARWLEVRLPYPENRLPGRLWPVAFAMIGVLLIFYREV
jgi:putative copper resistance protein D